jgi:AraC family ethanolamine operon transcriptional activator
MPNNIDMHRNTFDFGLRDSQTPYLSELAAMQSAKNRSYTQLKKGSAQNSYQEANLGSVQVIREKLGVSALVHAAPPTEFLPLGVLLPSSGNVRFCGQNCQEGTLLQGTGSEWDLCNDSQLDYIALVFEYSALSKCYQNLYQQELPQKWLISRARNINPEALQRYTLGVSRLLHVIAKDDALFQNPKVCQLTAAHAMELGLQVLMSNDTDTSKLSSHSYRINGVYKVIDYIQAYASQLPSMAELCAVAGLSERSLQYGFCEYLGVSPIRYLRVVRLNSVREMLLKGNRRQLKVSTAAMQWGFLELGRFSTEYRQLFNELPSATLNCDVKN